VTFKLPQFRGLPRPPVRHVGSNWIQIDHNHSTDGRLCSTGFQLLCTPYNQGYVYVHWPVR
jgi:hypothetical protein